MATARRTITIVYTAGVDGTQTIEALTNTSSPAEIEYVTLASGANTLTKPTGARCCTIVPPAGNTTAITLKGVTGDTGIALHLTDPAEVTMADAATSFCLTAAAELAGVRLFWS